MPEPVEINFKFERSSNFRFYPAAGVWGGLTPTGEIYAEFFTETFPQPNSITYEFNETGTHEKSREAFEKTILRQFEIGIIMNIQTAVTLKSWLEERISDWAKRNAEQPLPQSQMESNPNE